MVYENTVLEPGTLAGRRKRCGLPGEGVKGLAEARSGAPRAPGQARSMMKREDLS